MVTGVARIKNTYPCDGWRAGRRGEQPEPLGRGVDRRCRDPERLVPPSDNADATPHAPMIPLDEISRCRNRARRESDSEGQEQKDCDDQHESSGARAEVASMASPVVG